MRDVSQAIILPSLTRALDELSGKKGSRSRARMLIKHARDQLLELVHEEGTVAADPPQHETPVHVHDFSVNDVCTCGVPRVLRDGPDAGAGQHGHDFTYDVAKTISPTEHLGKCRCGAVEGSEEANQGCGLPKSLTDGAASGEATDG